MPAASWLWIGLGGLSLLGLLAAEVRRRPLARAAFKVACSLGFLLLALAQGLEGRFAQWVFAGLVLSALGDVFLIFPSGRAFLAGLVAFLLAHLAYVGAFAAEGSPGPWAFALVLGVGLGVVRWLWPHLEGWRVPVLAYAAVISLMLLFALATGRPEARLGALLFYLSDLFVARERFVRSEVLNPLLGLPLYYVGQYLLALSVG